jgi:hypothetical protein
MACSLIRVAHLDRCERSLDHLAPQLHVSARQHKEFNKKLGSRKPKRRWQQQLCRFHQACPAPKIASRDTTFFQERFEATSLTYRRGSKLSETIR